MKEVVRVYLDMLQRMHAPKFLGGVCALVIVLQDKLQLKKLAMGLSLTRKNL